MIDWYHTIELNGVTTKGRYDWRPYLKYFEFSNLNNKTILDVGAGDGFFSFEFEKMGAIVTALDLSRQSERDNFQFGELNKKTVTSRKSNFHNAFEFARNNLGSKVQSSIMNLYNLGEETFDVVFCNDVLLHFTDPVRALCVFSKICKVLIVGTPLYEPRNIIERLLSHSFATFLGASANHAFWLPNKKCFQDLVIGAGFKIKNTKVFKPQEKHFEYAGLRGIIVATNEIN